MPQLKVLLPPRAFSIPPPHKCVNSLHLGASVCATNKHAALMIRTREPAAFILPPAPPLFLPFFFPPPVITGSLDLIKGKLSSVYSHRVLFVTTSFFSPHSRITPSQSLFTLQLCTSPVTNDFMTPRNVEKILFLCDAKTAINLELPRKYIIAQLTTGLTYDRALILISYFVIMALFLCPRQPSLFNVLTTQSPVVMFLLLPSRDGN